MVTSKFERDERIDEIILAYSDSGCEPISAIIDYEEYVEYFSDMNKDEIGITEQVLAMFLYPEETSEERK